MTQSKLQDPTLLLEGLTNECRSIKDIECMIKDGVKSIIDHGYLHQDCRVPIIARDDIYYILNPRKMSKLVSENIIIGSDESYRSVFNHHAAHKMFLDASEKAIIWNAMNKKGFKKKAAEAEASEQITNLRKILARKIPVYDLLNFDFLSESHDDAIMSSAVLDIISHAVPARSIPVVGFILTVEPDLTSTYGYPRAMRGFEDSLRYHDFITKYRIVDTQTKFFYPPTESNSQNRIINQLQAFITNEIGLLHPDPTKIHRQLYLQGGWTGAIVSDFCEHSGNDVISSTPTSLPTYRYRVLLVKN